MNQISRRKFFKWAMMTTTGIATAGIAASMSACSPKNMPERPASSGPADGQAYLSVARGSNPAEITRQAIAALGGIERFVRSGNDVIIKPNICVNYHSYEYAATTNPTVVATLVELCLGAGAKRVRVMDMPFGGTPESAYKVSGIKEAVQAAGGEMEVMSPVKFVDTAIPDGRAITEWPVYQDVLNTDVLINVPIAKHHSLARLSLAGKNLLGVVTKPNQIHRNLGQRVADLVSLIRPTLTVVDAVRILVAHGPTGGSLNDVKTTDTIIASHDIVAADAWAATLFDLEGSQVPYIKAAAEMGIGTLDLNSIQVEEIGV
jgi:uncharacterized protein (DUF362 family)